MKKLIMFSLLVLSGCNYSGASKGYELEQMESDVLKKGTGVDIQIKPIPAEAKK